MTANLRAKAAIWAWVLGAAGVLVFIGLLALFFSRRNPSAKPPATTDAGPRNANLTGVLIPNWG